MKNLKDERMGVYQVHAALVNAGCHSFVTAGITPGELTSGDAIVIPERRTQAENAALSMPRDLSGNAIFLSPISSAGSDASE